MHRAVILFLWESIGEVFKQWFSVASDGRKESVKNRAIVSHVGEDPWKGEWTCSKDGREPCGHKRKALNHLVELTGIQEAGVDDESVPLQGIGERILHII